MAAKDELGRRGEDEAVRYLEQRGLVVLSRNWRCRDGELDVVAVDGDRATASIQTCERMSTFGSPRTTPAPNSASPANARTASGW